MKRLLAKINRRKALAFRLLILSALLSATLYLFLTDRITSGKTQLATGQKQLEREEPMLEDGKARLAAGKRELSEGKEEYKDATNNQFLVWVDDLFRDGKGFEKTEAQIAKGERQVAAGEAEVDAGEKRVDEGKTDLRFGRKVLGLAKNSRFVLALGMFLIICIFIVLLVVWRRKRGGRSMTSISTS